MSETEGDGWEERMGARARVRREAITNVERIAERAQIEADRNRAVAHAMRAMSVVDARRTVGFLGSADFACACVGGVNCCMVRLEAARRVLSAPAGDSGGERRG